MNSKIIIILTTIGLTLISCAKEKKTLTGLSGTVMVDGSSTVESLILMCFYMLFRCISI